MYPKNWRKCANCGEPALDGKETCGRVECSRALKSAVVLAKVLDLVEDPPEPSARLRRAAKKHLLSEDPNWGELELRAAAVTLESHPASPVLDCMLFGHLGQNKCARCGVEIV